MAHLRARRRAELVRSLAEHSARRRAMERITAAHEGLRAGRSLSMIVLALRSIADDLDAMGGDGTRPGGSA